MKPIVAAYYTKYRRIGHIRRDCIVIIWAEHERNVAGTLEMTRRGVDLILLQKGAI